MKWKANKMKNTDWEGGAPQGGNVVVMHVKLRVSCKYTYQI